MDLKSSHSPLKLYLEAMIRLFYPSLCGSCKSLLNLDETGVCGPCRSQLKDIQAPFMEGQISKNFQYLDEAWYLYPYKAPLKELLSRIKFSGERWLIRLFEEDFKMRLLALQGENHYDALIPVPIDRYKLLNRQFNQSELIAKLLSKGTGLPVKTSILAKSKRTPAQSQLNKAERAVNLKGAFAIKKNVLNKRFLLIDDIVTTGATAEEASRVLKLAGAKKVDILAIAYSNKES